MGDDGEERNGKLAVEGVATDNLTTEAEQEDRKVALQSQTEDQTPSPAFISQSDESCLQTVNSGGLIMATGRWEDGQTHPRGRDCSKYLIPTQGSWGTLSSGCLILKAEPLAHSCFTSQKFKEARREPRLQV